MTKKKRMVSDVALYQVYELSPAPADASAYTAAEANRRLPGDLRWSPVTSELVTMTPPEDLPKFTAADIDWRGLDQKLGDETSLKTGVEILILEVLAAERRQDNRNKGENNE